MWSSEGSRICGHGSTFHRTKRKKSFILIFYYSGSQNDDTFAESMGRKGVERSLVRRIPRMGTGKIFPANFMFYTQLGDKLDIEPFSNSFDFYGLVIIDFSTVYLPTF